MLTINKLRKYFPLQKINDVLKLCEDILDSKRDSDSDYNVIFLSILLGLIEYKLTQTNETEEINKDNAFQNNKNYADTNIFTIVFNDIMLLYKSFQSFVNEISNNTMFKNDRKFINRGHLKLITDVVFSKLSVAKYKENCHNQSIFSFLTDKSLDSFGLAYTILGVAHQLGYRQVYLALSEDHAWLEYDGDDGNSSSNNQRFTADIAWTGKNEDKRCSSIDLGIVERSRLYLGGNSVVCIDNPMTIAAAITTINPAKGSSCTSTNAYSNRSQNVASNHSLELAILKRDLLWIAYNKDLLKKYPLAVINLADLERNYPKFPEVPNSVDGPLLLYREAVDINVQHYDNCHVYPYLSMANYFYHYCNFTRAMKCWRMAANVISKYNYKSEDWIIYREFFDIATHFIPDIFRSVTKDDNPLSKSSDSLYQASVAGSSKDIKKPIDYKDIIELNPEQRESICEELKGCTDFLTEFLCFFDFICLWEEGSSVPVLHEVWANKFKEVLSRFNEETRVSLKSISVESDILNSHRSIDDTLSLPNLALCHIPTSIPSGSGKRIKESSSKFHSRSKTSKIKKIFKKDILSKDDLKEIKEFWKKISSADNSGISSILSSKVLNFDFLVNSNRSKIYDFSPCTAPVDYEHLLGDNSRQLQLEQDVIDYFATIKTIKRILAGEEENIVCPKPNGKSKPVPEDSANMTSSGKSIVKKGIIEPVQERVEAEKKEFVSTVPTIPLIEVFKSQKMREICPLVVAPGRLNIPAIKLPLTAQSQVSLKRTGLKTVYGSHSHEYPSPFSRKRFRRD